MHPQSLQLHALAERWENVPAGEFANAQMYLTELAQALGVEPPRPKGSGYEFEFQVQLVSRDGKESTGRIDLFKEGHFILEAKHAAPGASVERTLRAAYGQALSYTTVVPGGPPPYLLVLDVGRTLLAWNRWAGSYGGFNLARRIDLTRLADADDDVEFLRKVWEDPGSLDPRRRAARVTREVAEHLAELSASLERRGFEGERVARFLIRCVFTMFAEDVGLLHGHPFQHAIQEFGADPQEFAAAMEELWAAMDEGRRFGLRRLLRFNGHFFKEREALPLSRADLAVLMEAARADWTEVEPSIFGTLLVRALDPVERHRLGAEYTPREYVERVVRQTVEVPIRERWGPVQAEVLQLLESGRKKDRDTALRRLREFHDWLRGLRFLDPACGSGNFLYVTLHTVKRVELEVLREIEKITGQPDLSIEEVGPWQFHGIELKTWAREIAELTLWIGHHQFWKAHHGDVQPPEPVLRDTGTLEQRDAVLAWDEIVEVPEKSRPDPTPRIVHPVTGKLVPDPEVRLPYYEYRGVRQAEWPQADFIIGNPPYLGNKRMREVFGDGYVEALRGAYPEMPESADYVMYWWHRTAEEIAPGRTLRAGLITTNSITQTLNRTVVEEALRRGVGIAWAVADHPWVDEAGGASVRVAITVLDRNPPSGMIVSVNDRAEMIREVSTSRINADLTGHVDVASAAQGRLLANRGLASNGYSIFGRGFVLDRGEAEYLLNLDVAHAQIIKPYVGGRHLTQGGSRQYVIDFGLREEHEAAAFPVLFDIVRDRVKPERDANKREGRRRNWWRFGEPVRAFREAACDLEKFIGTAYVSKHRFFTFLPAGIAPDHGVIWIALDSAYYLGLLSSSLHVTWALAAGSRLGVGNDPRYNASLTFDPFPFPDPPKHLRDRIALVAEALDEHRKNALARDERVTMTGMYNVVEKLRSGEVLTAKEREVHEIAACGVLKDLHDELDRLVAEAYGWPWPMEREEILERLVALHDERVEEEKRGVVRWLRPEYQVPRFGRAGEEAAPELALPDAEKPESAEGVRPWPDSAVEQMVALKALVTATPATPEEASAAFRGARADLVQRHLETLALVGEVRRDESGRYHPVAEPL